MGIEEIFNKYYSGALISQHLKEAIIEFTDQQAKEIERLKGIEQNGEKLHGLFMDEINKNTELLKENTNLKEQLKQANERVKSLEEGIESGIDSLKSKHKAFLGTKGQESRDSFKLGLSWGWGAFENLLNN